MAISPLQTYLVGPSPSTSQNLQFPSNVVAGNLVVVKAWSVSAFGSNGAAVVDDQSNSYVNDVSDTIQSASSGYYFQTWLFRSVMVGGGVRPIVTVNFTNGHMIGGASITEYPVATVPPFDSGNHGHDDGSSQFTQMDSGSFTASNAVELLVAIGLTEAGTLSVGSGWTNRDSWATGSYVALGEDKSTTSSGSFNATINGVDGSSFAAWSICAASYKVTATTSYTDSIALGTQNRMANILAAEFDPRLSVGILSLESGLGTSSMAMNPALAIAAGFANILGWSTNPVGMLAAGQGLTVLPTWVASPTSLMGVSELIACSVVSSLFGVSVQGVLASLAAIGVVNTSATAILGAIVGALADTQRSYVDSIALGIFQAMATDAGKALVDAISLGGATGFNVQLANQPTGTIPLGATVTVGGQVAETSGPVALLMAALSLSCQTTGNIGAALGVFIGAALRSKLNFSTSGLISLNDIVSLFSVIPGGLFPGLVTIFDELVTRSTVSDSGVVVMLTDAPVAKGELSDI